MELYQALETVNDEISFLHFARLLMADRIDEVQKERNNPTPPFGRGANGWENGSIEQFLGGAIAWAESTDFGFSQGLSKQNPWRRFADFLYCGKIYE